MEQQLEKEQEERKYATSSKPTELKCFSTIDDCLNWQYPVYDECKEAF